MKLGHEKQLNDSEYSRTSSRIKWVVESLPWCLAKDGQVKAGGLVIKILQYFPVQL